MEYHITQSFARHKETVENSAAVMGDIEAGVALLIETLKNGKKILVCGNGGSAADSQHFVAEFVCKYKDDRAPVPAIALTVDSSIATAIGNDYGFDSIFSRQVAALGQKGDVLVVLTTSGRSKNILAAIAEAKRRGLAVIALTGAKGEHLRSMVDVLIAIPSEETARIQEVHELIYHSWCEEIDRILFSTPDA